jgi:hypothetical protein
MIDSFVSQVTGSKKGGGLSGFMLKDSNWQPSEVCVEQMSLVGESV